MMDDDRSWKFADLAPLTQTFATHLASYLLRKTQRPAGRPRKTEGADVVARTERRLLEAMDQLIPLIQTKRQTIYDLVNPVVSSGELTEKWLVQTLNQFTPGKRKVYPQRLAEWRKANLLLYNGVDKPEPNSVCCLLLARMINPNRTGWLPRPLAAESYWCWRHNAPDLAPFPYEMPLVVLDPRHPNVVIKPAPTIEAVPYILATPWKGAAWDSHAWQVVEGGAIRWVGLPLEDQIATWLSPQEVASLAPMASQVDWAEQALRILADRLSHRPSSDETT
jgi:hypothetical protein